MQMWLFQWSTSDSEKTFLLFHFKDIIKLVLSSAMDPFYANQNPYVMDIIMLWL